MNKRNIFLVASILLSTQIFGQSVTTEDVERPKSYLSLSITPHFNRPIIKNVSGPADQIIPWTTPGMVLDIQYLRLTDKFIYEIGLGHGFYNDGFFYRYNEINHPNLMVNDNIGYEKSLPLQYSSVKLMVSNNFFQNKSNFKFYGGLDARMNWGYYLFYNVDTRDDVSYSSSFDIDWGNGELSSTTWLESSGKVTNQISINPLIGCDYLVKFKNQAFVSIGLVYSIPFFPVIKSDVTLYNDFENVKTTFNKNHHGGFFGFKLSYAMPL